MEATKPPSPEFTTAPPESPDVNKLEVLINSRRACDDLDDYLRRVRQADRTREAFASYY